MENNLKQNVVYCYNKTMNSKQNQSKWYNKTKKKKSCEFKEGQLVYV